MKRQIIISSILGLLLILGSTSAQTDSPYPVGYSFSDSISEGDIYSWTVTGFSVNSGHEANTTTEVDSSVEVEALKDPEVVNIDLESPSPDNFEIRIDDEVSNKDQTIFPGIVFEVLTDGTVEFFFHAPLIFPTGVVYENGTINGFFDRYIGNDNDDYTFTSEDGVFTASARDGSETTIIDEETGIVQSTEFSQEWGEIKLELNTGFLGSLPVSPLFVLAFVPLLMLRRRN